jgi:hypothetical protein
MHPLKLVPFHVMVLQELAIVTIPATFSDGLIGRSAKFIMPDSRSLELEDYSNLIDQIVPIPRTSR